MNACERWAPYVSGRILLNEIDCPHLEMTKPDPIRKIGRLIEQHLRTLAEQSQLALETP
jgi:thioesterase domain-containing protein